jgi:hypothetical protein
MADKLSASLWTAFVKKHKLELDDEPFVKALTRLDKAGEDASEARLQALENVIEQAAKLVPVLVKRKKALGDRPFTEAKDKVHELEALAQDQLKQTRAAVAAAADDDAESPALLTTKMIPLIREVRKGDVVMQALIALAGKQTVVLLSRRPISPARGKLLKEQMTNPSGLKFIRGECLLENNAITFVVQAQAGGLAKRLRAALFDQTELRLKVRVRGEDPDDIEEDGESDEGDAAPLNAPGSEQAASAGVEPGADPLAVRFQTRNAEIEPLVMRTLAANAGDTSKIRAVHGFVAEKAAAKAWASALAGLDKLEALLAAAETSGRASASDAAPVGKVGLEVLRTEVRTIRVRAVGGISQLAQQLASDPHPQAAGISKVVKRLALDMPGELEGLLGQMDQAMQRKDAAAIAACRASIRKSAGDWIKFLQDNRDPILGCETNPWGIPIAIDKPMRASLNAILKTAQ